MAQGNHGSGAGKSLRKCGLLISDPTSQKSAGQHTAATSWDPHLLWTDMDTCPTPAIATNQKQQCANFSASSNYKTFKTTYVNDLTYCCLLLKTQNFVNNSEHNLGCYLKLCLPRLQFLRSQRNTTNCFTALPFFGWHTLFSCKGAVWYLVLLVSPK